MKNEINTKKFALSLTIVSAIFYIACALFIVIAPNFTRWLFNNLFHGLDITKIASASISFGSMLIGLVEVIVYALIAGWLFAIIYNKLIK